MRGARGARVLVDVRVGNSAEAAKVSEVRDLLDVELVRAREVSVIARCELRPAVSLACGDAWRRVGDFHGVQNSVAPVGVRSVGVDHVGASEAFDEADAALHDSVSVLLPRRDILVTDVTCVEVLVQAGTKVLARGVSGCTACASEVRA